jgi:hypothetical protein
MLAKKCVGRDDRGDVTQATTAQPVSAHSQATAFVVGQSKPTAQVRTEDAVFFNQIRQSCLLALVEPADQRNQQQSEGHRVEHGQSVYTSDEISGPRKPSAEQ